MRIVACHTCWSWVAPSGAACPECLYPLDPLSPDPPRQTLIRTFGEFITRLSIVRLERTSLPRWGSLLGTSEGLLFLPYFSTHTDGSLVPLQDESRWSQWRFWKSSPQPAFPHMPQWSADDWDVVQQFFDAPGSLFIPRDQILRFHLRTKVWAISRTFGSVVRLTPLSPTEEWQPAWRQLVAQHPSWQTWLKL